MNFKKIFSNKINRIFIIKIGTFRKNIDIWEKWNFAHACNLHGIQARIANRSAELLKPGGLMVFNFFVFS